MVLFSKSNKVLLGHFEPLYILFDNQSKLFRGDLSAVSAKTKTLEVSRYLTHVFPAKRRPKKRISGSQHNYKIKSECIAVM